MGVENTLEAWGVICSVGLHKMIHTNRSLDTQSYMNRKYMENDQGKHTHSRIHDKDRRVTCVSMGHVNDWGVWD